jgi:hypothetical protein
VIKMLRHVDAPALAAKPAGSFNSATKQLRFVVCEMPPPAQPTPLLDGEPIP